MGENEFQEKSSRIIVVSNRLPITVKVGKDDIEFQRSPGGLASGLSSYVESVRDSRYPSTEHLWIGWPGVTLPKKLQGDFEEKALEQYCAYPVYLSESEMDRFYNGFCNKMLWPLFHFFPGRAVYEADYWTTYKSVNEEYCSTILRVARETDTIWIHDYHLMLLPKLLREHLPDATIGFFLHIPFPSYEIYRLLPISWRREILLGLLGADLLGFHTYGYTQNFLRSVLRTFGIENNFGQMFVDHRNVVAETFPMGINYNEYAEIATHRDVRQRVEEIRKRFKNMKIVFSVDRLDYTKGILNRLQGFELFLERNPEWRKKVILMLVVVPSRIGVEHYQQMKRDVDELVGKINGRFGTVEWTPIIYQYQSLPQKPLVSLYASSDVALVTPLRDGMNLIAKEYLACRTDQTGVLVLSEMAGAAEELGESLLINPNDKSEIADSIRMALELPIEEQKRRNKAMQERLKRYNVVRWAEDFMQKLQQTKVIQQNARARKMTGAVEDQIVQKYITSRRRLFLLDYDGTLVRYVPTPEEAAPPTALIELLASLAAIDENELVLLSGRDRRTLEKWFGSLPLSIVSEHGVWKKKHPDDWIQLVQLRSDWKGEIYPLLEVFVDRLPGSLIEEKEFSLAWHYRRSDPELGSLRAKELMNILISITANRNLHVLQGHKVLEIRSGAVNKGVAALEWIGNEDYDFIFAAGDDWTDEDLFQVLPAHALSVKVGMQGSHARCTLDAPDEVIQLLKTLASLSSSGHKTR